MTVKNYVLDINKTSLQHPSIVLRQDDYNIYTINVSVTDNGVPVNLGSYTLNFLGITPAGAKIIDSKNFITNAGDLKNGKFSYKFPKEAAGSKGVYDVAYFRLKTTSGATSTIDLNLRVLGGVDLTADDVKDYITVDDTLRNTLVSEVFKRVDAKVDKHLATVKKGDKGDTGPAGKDGYMPVIGGRNYILNSNVSNTDYIMDGFYSSVPLSYFNHKILTISARLDYDNLTVIEDKKRMGVEFNIKDKDGNSNYIGAWKYPSIGDSFHGRISATVDFSNKEFKDIETNKFYGGIYVQGIAGTGVSISKPKLEIGNVATDWTSAPEDLDNRYVQKAGDTMTGGLKGGLIHLPASGDLNTLTDTGKYYQSTNVNTANWANRPSNAPTLAFSVDVIGHANQSLTTQVYYVHTTSRMWVRTMWKDGTTMGTSQWAELANDSNVVHNTGNETVAGNKTLTGLTTILTGNYGFRVTSSGFEKTTDGGKKWVKTTL